MTLDPALEEAKAAAYARCNEWNFAHPSGTPVLAWPGTRSEEPLRTRTRHSAWVLESGMPVISVEGYAGGIHLDHIEHDPTRQPAVPDISFEPPPCPICDRSLDSDGDSLTCVACSASWSTSGTSGRWDDPNEPRCPATRCWNSVDLPDDQCILAADHASGTHRLPAGLGWWTDDDPRAVIDSDGDPIP